MNVLGMGPMELLLILIIGLIVFGPGKLPEIMGQVGKAINDFRRATSEITEEFNRTIQAEVQETRAAVEGTQPPTASAATSQLAAAPAPAPEVGVNGTGAAEPVPPLDSSAGWHWEGAEAAETAAAEDGTGEKASPPSTDATAAESGTRPRKPADPELLPPY